MQGPEGGQVPKSASLSSIPTQDQGCDQLLRDACDGLWTHLEVLEWCVEQSRYSPVQPAPSHHWADLTLCSVYVTTRRNLRRKGFAFMELTSN